jgi:hypothetical protein
MKHSLEYYSLHYLDMWLKYDRLYHEALNNGTCDEKLSSIKMATTYYKVARNLPKECDEGNGRKRYEPILDIIDKVVVSDFSDNTLKSISKIQSKISKAYGGKGVLSVTTKLLWLKIRSPIIIYDSQARIALNTPDGDLPSFYSAWRAKYDTHRKDIVTVCAKLSKVAEYAYDQTTATPSYVQKISVQPWLQERVFDMYLWHQGQ